MKLSVLLITYNHAAFIRQALDSVLMQETDEPFEILVSEDCSTDGTREIVCEYERRHRGRIRLLLSERNLRSNAVVARGIAAAAGEYLALLDGDDYWLTPDKLRKQVDYLDRHGRCAFCFHNARVVGSGEEDCERNWTPGSQPATAAFEDIWYGNFIATCSTMYRRASLGTIPVWYDDFFPITDWPLHILSSRAGDIGYINEILGAYRLHSGGCYSPWSERRRLAATFSFYRRINACLDHRYDRLAKTAISKYFMEWVEEYLHRGDRRGAIACYRYYLAGRPVNRHVSLRRMLINLVRIVVPAALLPRRRRPVHDSLGSR